MPSYKWISLDKLDQPNHEFAEYALDLASFVLWSLSGRKYSGVQTTTEQYVCPDNDIPSGCSWVASDRFFNDLREYYGYVYLNTSTGGTGFQRIYLRNTPIRRVISVEVGGVELNPSEYQLRDNSQLVLKGAYGLCDGPVVTYSFGTKPPFGGEAAAIELANEIIKGYDRDDDCQLPERTTSISRQGVNISMIDPNDFFERGQVGLYTVDLFLAAVNPTKSKKRPKLFSPDRPKGYRTR